MGVFFAYEINYILIVIIHASIGWEKKEKKGKLSSKSQFSIAVISMAKNRINFNSYMDEEIQAFILPVT